MRHVDGCIYVVDNHSRDGSVEYLRESFPDVEFISSNHNLGFARANNIAIRQTESEYVLLLNPDTIVGEHVIEDTLKFMDTHDKAGGLGVCMLKSNGGRAMESRRGLPSPMTAFYKMCGLCTHFPYSRRFGKYYMSYLPWDKPARIEVVSGAFCMLRRKAINKAGLLDEDFFMYGEDIDLSYRLIKSGYENWYNPAKILHYKGESTHKTSFRYVHVFYDAMLIFFRKHYGHLKFWITLPIKTAIYAKAMLALFATLTERVRMMLGFRTDKNNENPEYIFVMAKSETDKCRHLARINGLSAHFIECNENDLTGSHKKAIEQTRNGVQTYIVYDTEIFSYEQIFELFDEQPNEHLNIGTYYRNGMIITDQDIFR